MRKSWVASLVPGIHDQGYDEYGFKIPVVVYDTSTFQSFIVIASLIGRAVLAWELAPTGPEDGRVLVWHTGATLPTTLFLDDPMGVEKKILPVEVCLCPGYNVAYRPTSMSMTLLEFAMEAGLSWVPTRTLSSLTSLYRDKLPAQSGVKTKGELAVTIIQAMGPTFGWSVEEVAVVCDRIARPKAKTVPPPATYGARGSRTRGRGRGTSGRGRARGRSAVTALRPAIQDAPEEVLSSESDGDVEFVPAIAIQEAVGTQEKLEEEIEPVVGGQEPVVRMDEEVESAVEATVGTQENVEDGVQPLAKRFCSRTKLFDGFRCDVGCPPGCHCVYYASGKAQWVAYKVDSIGKHAQPGFTVSRQCVAMRSRQDRTSQTSPTDFLNCGNKECPDNHMNPECGARLLALSVLKQKFKIA